VLHVTQCRVCQRGFVAQARTGPTPAYCSRECAEWWRCFSRRAKNIIKAWNIACDLCGRAVYVRGTQPRHYAGKGTTESRYCSTACRQYVTGERSEIHDRCRLRLIDCESCGTPIVARGGPRLSKCPPCRKLAEMDKNRRKNYKRRLARNAGDGYTLAEIIERDAGKCHLCIKVVDTSLPGSHPQGPTIDHILPISDGGADTRANVALAHRQCNVARGNRGAMQLRLVG
jgi:5-methylcytosine-specific restriction endonuclease McrA